MFKSWAINDDAMGRKFLLFKPDSDLVGLEIEAKGRGGVATKGCLMFTRDQLVDLLRYHDDPTTYYTGGKV